MIPFINIHTHSTSNTKNIFELLNIIYNWDYKAQTIINSQLLDNEKFYSVAMHPKYIPQNTIKWALRQEINNYDFEVLEEFISKKNVLAIGETGLDKLYSKDLTVQLAVFMRHIELAEKYQKPLIIHCVKSFEEIISAKRKSKSSVAWVIHGFNKNLQTAQMLIRDGFYVSFGNSVLQNKNLQETMKNIPIDKLLLETDDKSSENIIQIYNTVSQILSYDIEQLKSIIIKNFNCIFKTGSKLL